MSKTLRDVLLEWHSHYITLAFTAVSPRMGSQGWPFANVDPFPAAGVDPINHAEHIKDLYLKAEPEFDGRYVPRKNRFP